MDYQVAIPSFRRSALLMQETMQTLRNVEKERITVFVSDAEDIAAYKKVLPEGVTLVNTGAKNATEKFNAIHYHYAQGTRVFCIEDDIQLVHGSGKTNDGKPLEDVHSMIVKGFEADRVGGIWGIVPHSNAFYFSGGVSHTLKLIVAHAFGFTSTGDKWLACTQPSKTDYERTCRYWVRYGEVTRLENYGAKTKSYTMRGGMQADYTKEVRWALEEQSVAGLTSRFPLLLTRKEKKTSPFSEMRFLPCKMGRDDLIQYQRTHDRLAGEKVSP